jgi:hypothetical protein
MVHIANKLEEQSSWYMGVSKSSRKLPLCNTLNVTLKATLQNTF